MRKLKVGDKVKAIMPNGEIERGIVIKREKRLWLDEGHDNVYAIDGGFLEGTRFESDTARRNK